MIRHPGDGRPRADLPRRQRGAALVEYALGMGLIGMLAVIGFRGVTSAAGTQLQRKSNVGAPDLAPLSVAETTTTVPGSTTPEAPTTTLAPFAARASMTGSGVKDHGNIWIATATVTVTNSATNAVVPQAVVTGQWSGSGSGDTSCITQSNGTCQLTLADIDGRTRTSVTLTLSSATSSSFTTVQLPAPLLVNEP